jgi:hypothetical protein
VAGDALAPERVERAVPTGEDVRQLGTVAPVATSDDVGADRSLDALTHPEQHRVRLGERHPECRREVLPDEALTDVQLEDQLVMLLQSAGGSAHDGGELGRLDGCAVGPRVGRRRQVPRACAGAVEHRGFTAAAPCPAEHLVPGDCVQPRLHTVPIT